MERANRLKGLFKRTLGTCFCLVTMTSFIPLLSAAQVQGKPVLSVLSVKLEPVRQGKNIVHVSVVNPSATSQNFVADIQARSPDYGRGAGWGNRMPQVVAPGSTHEFRFAYGIPGPVTEKTRLTLSFYNPADPEKFDAKSYFLRRQYSGPDLMRAKSAAAPPVAPADEAAAAISALKRFQDALRAKRTADAWQAVSGDFRAIYFFRTEAEFATNIVPAEPSPYLWRPEDLLGFNAASAARCDDGRILLRPASGAGLEVFMAREEGRWKLDEISGFTPQLVLWANWQERLLPTLETRRSEHFDIFFARGSSAAKDVDSIAAERDKGFQATAEFLGTRPGFRIKLVFFEDGRTKAWETGHDGAGWAYDRTIVEVFNAAERLDPFHEVCHILADEVGDPPALFNEGLAVYMSERLGAPALKGLGGRSLSIDERVRELKSRNEWVPFGELLQFNEIGSDETKPDSSYAEAASFVKFLVETYGREKFLAAYRALKNPSDPAIRAANQKALETIYGMTPDALSAAWERKVLSGPAR